MKSVLCFSVVAIVIGFAATGQSLAQNRNSISGFVFDEARAPVPQVHVELQDENYSMVGRVQTRGSGMFSFGGLPEGRYIVRVMTAGTNFEEQTRNVSLIPLVRGGTTIEQLDFYLKPRQSRRSGPASSPAVVFVQDVPAEAKNLYLAALEDLQAKNDQGAFDKLKRSIEMFPDYFMALDLLGNEYVTRGYYEPAFLLLSKAVSINRRSHSSSLGLGLASYRLGQVDKAISHFKTAVEVDNISANGYLWLGIALHANKKYVDALQALFKANDLSNGAVAEVHWQLARVYKDQNKFDKSADELELFLKYSPEAKNSEEIKGIIASLRSKK
jgi:tetratricopeptide (TPR) repeat protein